MNVPFTIPHSQDLEKAFVAQAAKEGMLQLKGHRHACQLARLMHPRSVKAATASAQHRAPQSCALSESYASCRGACSPAHVVCRSVGGMRASIYNAMPEEGVQKLASFMKVGAGCPAGCCSGRDSSCACRTLLRQTSEGEVGVRQTPV